MPKVLFVTDADYPQVNGVVRHLYDLLNALKKKRWKYRLISPKHFTKKITLAKKEKIEWVYGSKKELYKKIEDYSPDFVHILTEGSLGLMARKYCTTNKIPFSTSIHTDWAGVMKHRYYIPSRISWLYMRYFHKHSSLVFVPSAIMQRKAEQEIMRSTTLMPNTVDISVFKKNSEVCSKEKTLLFVGRICKEKNIEPFLECKINAKKVVVGDGPEKERLESKYSTVLFTGNKSTKDLVCFYNAASVLVFPSQIETFGIVLLEALACGTPIAMTPSVASKNIQPIFPDHVFVDSDIEKAIAMALQKKEKTVPKNISQFSSANGANLFINAISPFLSS